MCRGVEPSYKLHDEFMFSQKNEKQEEFNFFLEDLEPLEPVQLSQDEYIFLELATAEDKMKNAVALKIEDLLQKGEANNELFNVNFR